MIDLGLSGRVPEFLAQSWVLGAIRPTEAGSECNATEIQRNTLTMQNQGRMGSLRNYTLCVH